MEENKLNFRNAFLLTAVVGVLLIAAMMYRGSSTEAVHIELNNSVAISANRLGRVINSYAFDEDGRMVGDCFNTENRDVTPVPGGVGLLTRLALLENMTQTLPVESSELEGQCSLF